MHTSAKLGLTGLIAALVLASALSAASARRFEVSNQRIRVTWSRLEFGNPLFTARCQVTLEGSFHSRTIAKVTRTLVGAITRVNIKSESCTNGAGTPRGLPWHLTSESFTGTLPSITSVRLLLSRFLLTATGFGLACDYGTATDNVTFSAALNETMEVTSFAPVEGRNIGHLLAGSFFCPPEVRLTAAPGDGPLRLLNSTTRIRITLI